MTSRKLSSRKRGRRAALFQLVFVLVLVTVVVASFGLNLAGSEPEPRVPPQLGNLEEAGMLQGSEAIDRVARLHNLEIELADAYIVEYRRGSELASVWVGEADSSGAAAKLTDRMLAAIERGGSGFGNVRQIEISGQGVYKVDGPGGEHFFYHSRKSSKLVVWLTIDAADSLAVVRDAIKNF